MIDQLTLQSKKAMKVITLKNKDVRRTDMFQKIIVTWMADPLIAHIETISVKERHPQNMYNETKKRMKLTRTY